MPPALTEMWSCLNKTQLQLVKVTAINQIFEK